MSNDNVRSTPKQRTRCLIYSRVMWFIRPVSAFNIWKKGEYFTRTNFKTSKPPFRATCQGCS